MRKAAALGLGCALAAALAVAVLGALDFFVARGSETGVSIYRVPLAVRLITLAAVAALWILSVVHARASANAATRWGLRIAGLLALALATHAVCISHRRGMIEEHWLLWRFDRLAFNAAEGIAHDWTLQPHWAGASFTHRQTGERRYVFTGVPPWQAEPGEALQR